MFSKMKPRPTLVETYEEEERVEAEKESIADYPDLPKKKTTMEKSLLMSKPKEEQSHDFQGMLKMIQKLSNRIIDLEKEREVQKTYKPHYQKREDNNQLKIPPPNLASMNITEVGGDNFCTFHQQPHSKKNCCQWLNSMTLVMNKLLDSKLTKDSSKEEEKKQTIEKQDNDTMFLWNGVSLFNTEENSLKSKYTPTATKDTDLAIKDNTIISKIKKLQENVKRQVDVKVKDKTPEVPTVNQETEPISKPVKLMGE